MITIAICDDDTHSLSCIHELVEQALPEGLPHVIIDACGPQELHDLVCAGTQVDVLFCDVIMQEGQPTGIQMVSQLFPPESGTQVIYVSGYLQQALEVYVTKHVYFLLKPIDPERLSDALNRALAQLSRTRPVMLRIKVGHKEQLINASSILYLESRLHKVIVHCLAREVETYAKLDALQTQLPNTFSRCHRSFVVNLAAVSSLDENEVTLHDGTRLPVSRRRAHELQHDLLMYLASRS